MNKGVMIDLETMSTASNAAIMQYGLVLFDLDGNKVEERLSGNICLQSSICAGGVVDPETIKWWQSQPRKMQETLYHNSCSLEQALGYISAFFNQCGEIDGVWSHGASFDIPILESAYRSVGMKTPWRYSQARDTRTIHALAESMGWKRPEREDHHVALGDALGQVEDLRSAINHIKRGI